MPHGSEVMCKLEKDMTEVLGHPTISVFCAVIRRIEKLGLKRNAVMTPYELDVNNSFIRALAASVLRTPIPIE